MAYASWSVVANEQPSTSKWNILGTNDAYFDSLVGSGTAWTSYVPAWTAGGGTVAIGNGTLSGGYQQFGKTIHFWFNMVVGTTTAVNTSTDWFFSVPVTASASLLARTPIGTGHLSDSGVADYHLNVELYSTTVFYPTLIKSDVTYATVTGLAYNLPTAMWSNGDYMRFSGTYQAA